jgi:hypothetical protein
VRKALIAAPVRSRMQGGYAIGALATFAASGTRAAGTAQDQIRPLLLSAPPLSATPIPAIPSAPPWLPVAESGTPAAPPWPPKPPAPALIVPQLVAALRGQLRNDPG